MRLCHFQQARQYAPEAVRLPYLVSIRRPGSHDHVCTGVLIGDVWVLTVAHCVNPVSPYAAGKKPLVLIGARSVADNSLEVTQPFLAP